MAAPEPTLSTLRRARALAQGLHRPAGLDVHGSVRRLLAVQGQDLRSARRAVRARTAGSTAEEVDAALDDRSLLITWLNRGTLHLVTPDDYPWLLGLTAPTTLKANERRLRQEGVGAADAERGVHTIVDALADEGPLTRAVLGERLATAGVPQAGQAIVHLLLLTGLRGLTVRGPVTSASGQAFALTRDWLGTDPPPAALAGEARDAALTELARRYLTGHGPATDADLATWAGLGLRDARRGLAAIAGELTELGGGVVDFAGRADRAAERDATLEPRLLGSFDPLVIGWKRRDHVVDPEHQPTYFTKNGILPAVMLVRGRAIGSWALSRSGGGVELRPYDEIPIPAATRRALEADGEDLARFEGRRR